MGMPIRYVRNMGTPQDWACIEAELGLKDVDSQRRERLWHELKSPFRVYLPHYQEPDLRTANLVRALNYLKKNAQRLRDDISFWENLDSDSVAELTEIIETSASDEEMEARCNARSLA